METIIDLLPRITNIMRFELEDNEILMSEKDAWSKLLGICKQNQAEALIDDMGEYVDMYEQRINLITEHLKSFK